MSRRSWWKRVRVAALTVALACGLAFALATAQAQVAPAEEVLAEPAAVEEIAEGEEVLEPEAPSPWTMGLITSTIALSLGGISAVLGIWVDRDKSRPVVYAGAMSVLITAAVTVGLTQGYLDATGAIQQKEDLKRMMDMVNEIAVASGDPELAKLVASEGGPVVEVPVPAPVDATAVPTDTDAAAVPTDPAAAPVDPAATPTPPAGH
jgi:hypothetical protein